MFKYEVADQNYIIPCWWWRTGDLTATLAQSQELLVKIEQDKIHLLKVEIIENDQLFLLKNHDKC